MALTTTARLGLAMVTAMLVGACATTPTGPSTLVLPGDGKTHDEFRVDDARCRPVAAAEVQATEGGYVSSQARYDMVYVQCMYAAGHQVPVRGAPVRSRDAPPSPPSATPAPAPATR